MGYIDLEGLEPLPRLGDGPLGEALAVYEGEPGRPDDGGRVEAAHDVHHCGPGYYERDRRLFLVGVRDGNTFGWGLDEGRGLEQDSCESPVVAGWVVRLDDAGYGYVETLLDPDVWGEFHAIPWAEHEAFGGRRANDGLYGPRLVGAGGLGVREPAGEEGGVLFDVGGRGTRNRGRRPRPCQSLGAGAGPAGPTREFGPLT